MTLKSFNGDTVIFLCPGCDESNAGRKIDVRSIILGDLEQIVTMQLPPCKKCNAVSTIFFDKQNAAVTGPISHCRAVLLHRCYMFHGGDDNKSLPGVKDVINKLKKSYKEDCTNEARRQFLGKSTFKLLDGTFEPINKKQDNKIDKPLKDQL